MAGPALALKLRIHDLLPANVENPIPRFFSPV
jgi:hypothetical protein